MAAGRRQSQWRARASPEASQTPDMVYTRIKSNIHSPLRPISLLILSCITCTVSHSSIAHAFQFHPGALGLFTNKHNRILQKCSQLCDTLGNKESSSSLELSSDVDLQSLMVMDVVLFQRRQTDSTPRLELGAVQENGNVVPLSCWTLESAYSSSTEDKIAFVVDEEDMYPGFSSKDIRVVKLLDMIDYGARQVGGGKGPGNPHGEESETLYYVDRDVVEGTYEWCGDGAEKEVTIDVVVNSELEHLW